MRNCLKYLLLTILISPVWGVAAPVYKWVDEEGQIHFSDRPLGEPGQAEQTGLQTDIPSAKPNNAEDFSIMKQMEYFDAQREKEQAAREARWQRIREAQEARERARAEEEAERQAAAAIESPQILVVPRPYYRPHPYARPGYPPYYPQPRANYGLRYTHQGDHHSLDLRLGNPSYRPAIQPYGSPYRPFGQSYGLNYWKY